MANDTGHAGEPGIQDEPGSGPRPSADLDGASADLDVLNADLGVLDGGLARTGHERFT
ncbi:hypothetical protein [Prauserella marina]|uniref:hypothetical protein n=1 Tax=Prauserella marina TaxID=530584 RepID=UPI001474F9DE|nr:hypothetical protein [Prauserella marina]